MAARIGATLLLLAGLAAGSLPGLAQQPAPPPVAPPAAAPQPAQPLPAPPPVVAPAGSPAPKPAEGEQPAEAAKVNPAEPEAPAAAAGKPKPSGAPSLAEDVFQVEADSFQYEDGALIARGHVRIHHGDMLLTGDEGRIDKERVWAEVSGNILVTSPNQRTSGQKLRINLDTEEWQLTGGRTQLDPGFFPETQLKEPIFLSGQTLVSTPDRNLVVADQAAATSCDHLDAPHYDVTADHITLNVDKDVTLDHPSVYLFGRRVFRYPGKIRLSLTQKQARLVPEVGQDDVNGFFIKLGYPYVASRSAQGLIRLQLTQKRGIGAGVDHYFDTGRQSGEVSFFYEPSESAYSALVQHRYQFTPELSETLNASLQSNSGYGLGTSSSLSYDLGLHRDTADAHTTFDWQQSQTTGGGFGSNSFTSNLTHQQHGPAGIDWTWSSIWQSSDFGSTQPSDDELDLSADLHRGFHVFDSDLSYQQHFNLGPKTAGEDSYFFAMDELPNLVLTSDTDRLGWKALGIPITTRIELGRFLQQPENFAVNRALFDAEMSGKTIRLAKEHQVQTGLAFRQSFYSEGSAQYDIQANAAFQSHWGGPWYSQLLWAYELPEGFAPLRTDFAAKQNNVNVDFSHYVANRSRVEIQTGYDLELHQWQDLVLRSEFTPNLHNRFEIQTAYDLNFHQLRPFEAQWQFVREHHLNLTLSTTYDLQNSLLGQVAVDSDWVVSPQWRFESLVGYDGTLRNFSYLEARVTRDLHCWLGSVAYSFSNREIRVNFGLKAFPFQDWEYGLGNRGQLLTPSQGQYY